MIRLGPEANHPASTAEPIDLPTTDAAAEPVALSAAEDVHGAFSPARPRRFWTLSNGKAAPVAVDVTPEEAVDPLAAFSPEAEIAERRAKGRRWSRDRWLAVAATLIAIAEAVLLVRGAPFFNALGAEGRLRIASDPAGAEVLVDGRSRGATPLDLGLSPGTHRVQVRRAGFVRDITAEVRAGGDSQHYVELPAPVASEPAVAATAGGFAALEITSDPPGARVSIDGRLHGVTPLQVADLAPGTHEVLLAGANGSITRRVRVSAGATSSLSVALPKAAPASAGWLTVDLPIRAQIYAGGDLVGTTDVDRLMLPAGRHTLRLVNAELNFDSRQTVDITPGATRALKVVLPNGRLSINALPWAVVFVDGEARGETPIGNLDVPIGPHEVVLRHPELGEQRRSVSVTFGGVTRVGVDLRK